MNVVSAERSGSVMLKPELGLIMLLVAILLQPSLLQASAQPPFLRYPSNPVLTNGTGNSWDAQLVTSPFVLQMGSLYKMWYLGFNSSATSNSQTGGIGYASSTDGIHWIKTGLNPVLTGDKSAWDASLEASSVYFNGSDYLMWYTGTANGVQEQRRIGFAYSGDGVFWTKYPGNPVLSSAPWASSVWAPWVLSVNHNFWMFFLGLSNTPNGHGFRYWSIGLAQSINGVNWTVNPDPILAPGVGSWDSANLFRPTVIYNGSAWQMWYTGQPLVNGVPGNPFALGYATSSNGVSWYKYIGNPIMRNGTSGAWDNGGVGFSAVLNASFGVKMWYTGWHQGALLFPPGKESLIGYSITPFSVTFHLGYSTYSFQGIIFNGTRYNDGQTGGYNFGNYSAYAIPPPPILQVAFQYCNERFDNWTATGNLAIASPKENPTSVTVSGPGSLTANSRLVCSGPISPVSILVASLVVALSSLYTRKLRRPRITRTAFISAKSGYRGLFVT